MFIFISQAKKYLNQEVSIRGWLRNKRSSGKLLFLEIRDGFGFMQAVVVKNSAPEAFTQAEKLTLESSLVLTGTISKHPKLDECELQVKSIAIVHLNTEEYPIAKKGHGMDFLLDYRHLWLRSKKQWAIQKVRHTIINAVYEYFNKNGFTKIDSPILTPSACEGTTTLFKVDCFGEPRYLSQSGQLYLEAAIFSLNKVFDFGPVFRAEKSKTRRHLVEFWMMDAEMAFVEHEENMKVQEELICHIIGRVLEQNEKELMILERDIQPLQKIKAPFIRKTHQEAIKEVQMMGSEVKEDDDLGAAEETLLTKQYDRPIFVEKYPASVKAFYMKPDPEDKSRVLCADLLAPEGYGEIIGGSQREDDYDKLVGKIKEHKLPLDAFNWYLDLRKYGSVPHSGFGLGLERVVAWLCGLKHVRETIPFPRMLYRMKP